VGWILSNGSQRPLLQNYVPPLSQGILSSNIFGLEQNYLCGVVGLCTVNYSAIQVADGRFLLCIYFHLCLTHY